MESAGSLTPEELGQMQAMSVVLARFSLSVPSNQKISTFNLWELNINSFLLFLEGRN